MWRYAVIIRPSTPPRPPPPLCNHCHIAYLPPQAAGIVYLVTLVCFRVVIPGLVFVQFANGVFAGGQPVANAVNSGYPSQVAMLGATQLLSLGLQLFFLGSIVSRLCRARNDPRTKKERIQQKRAAAGVGGGTSPPMSRHKST